MAAGGGPQLHLRRPRGRAGGDGWRGGKRAPLCRRVLKAEPKEQTGAFTAPQTGTMQQPGVTPRLLTPLQPAPPSPPPHPLPGRSRPSPYPRAATVRPRGGAQHPPRSPSLPSRCRPSQRRSAPSLFRSAPAPLRPPGRPGPPHPRPARLPALGSGSGPRPRSWPDRAAPLPSCPPGPFRGPRLERGFNNISPRR